MKNLFFIAVAVIFFVSCEQVDETVQLFTSYQPVAPGSYWVYDHYLVKPDHSAELIPDRRDSLYVAGDTIIRGETYAVIRGTDKKLGIREPELLCMMRDSSGYLVNQAGEILLATDRFGEVVRTQDFIINGTDTMYTCTYVMHQTDAPVTVPAGTFEVIDYRGKVVDRFHTQPRYRHDYYARDIGKVLSTYFYLSDSTQYFESRLVKFQIAE